MTRGNLHNLRRNYDKHRLNDAEIAINPFDQFALWFADATQLKGIEPNAMLIATLSESGRVSSRTVLLKSFSELGFVFYTNYNSQKARDIAYHPWVSLTFFWEPLQRQVHIQGKAERVDAATSDAYFAERPYGSQLGAWVSPQSEVIPDRQYLEDREAEMNARFAKEQMHRPPHWGGFLVVPDRFEFWQGRPNRLHDRIAYRLTDQAKWENQRLAP